MAEISTEQTGTEDKEVFSASYSHAVVRDPLSGIPEEYLCIGLNSKVFFDAIRSQNPFDGEGIRKYGRPKLNLVIVLDISGSMSSSFDDTSQAVDNRSKIAIAK